MQTRVPGSTSACGQGSLPPFHLNHKDSIFGRGLHGCQGASWPRNPCRQEARDSQGAEAADPAGPAACGSEQAAAAGGCDPLLQAAAVRATQLSRCSGR